MKYKLTARFLFHNTSTLTVHWIESGLNKQGKDEHGDITEVPLTVEEVEMHFRGVFLKYMKEMNRMSIPSMNGFVEIIPFEMVFRMSFKVTEYVEKGAEVDV